MKQNLKQLQIFGNRISIFIYNKNYKKLDIQKSWKNILINYMQTSKI